MLESPVHKKRRIVSAIWILPITAAILCGWLLYKSYLNAGLEITIYFEDASGITAGKTQVMSMGFPIGTVKSMYSELDNNRVKTVITMNRDVEKFLVDDTIFWVVKPEISASRIVGLETIFSGSYIGIQAGRSKKKRSVFYGQMTPPPIADSYPGLHIILKSQELNSVQEGSGIYYKNIQIGSVQSYKLQKEDDLIHIRCHIQKQFSHLVKPLSQFINISGLSITGSMTNVKLHMESLATILKGGIYLRTPNEHLYDKPVENNHVFTLFEDIEKADFGTPMTLELASGDGIVEGATKVIYKGIEVGYVQSISMNEGHNSSVTAHILLNPQAELILKKDTIFWMEETEISMDGIKNISSLLTGPHITFIPGNGEFCNQFTIAPQAPPHKPNRKGRTYILESDTAISTYEGSPVLYKNIEVGEIIDIRLNKTSGNIETEIFIYEENLELIRTNSVFWNQGGVTFDANLQEGFQLKAGPIADIIRGGISFITPSITSGKNQSKTAIPENLYRFPLYTSQSEAEDVGIQMQPKGVYFTIKTDSMDSLSTGSPILYKKVPIGELVSYTLEQDAVILNCFIQSKYTQYLNKNSRFYNLSGMEITAGLDGLKVNTGSVSSILAGGIGLFNPYPPKGSSRLPKHFSLYSNLEEAKAANQLKLHITLPAADIKKNSPVKYLGVQVGKVHNLSFTDNLQHIVADIRVDRKYLDFFREQTEFWVVKSEVSLSGVKHLETVLFGPYLTFKPGAGKLVQQFTASSQSPAKSPLLATGLNITLVSKSLGSLSLDAPVYYRRMKVGKVTGFELDSAFQKVLINVNIDEKYTSIIRSSTKFWNISGARFEGGVFSGLKVQTDSLESIIQGGIALATRTRGGTSVSDGERFILYNEANPEWLDWNPNLFEVDAEKETF